MARNKRSSKQINLPVRTFSFRLSNEKPQEKIARSRLELMETEGGNLRDAIIHWLTRNENELLIVHHDDVTLAVQDAFARFKADFFMEVLDHIRVEHPAALQEYVNPQAVSGKPVTPLTPEFITGVLGGMKKRS